MRIQKGQLIENQITDFFGFDSERKIKLDIDNIVTGGIPCPKKREFVPGFHRKSRCRMRGDKSGIYNP